MFQGHSSEPGIRLVLLQWVKHQLERVLLPQSGSHAALGCLFV